MTATLYYQTTSKEYVEFLRDENHTNAWGQVFYDLWATTDKSAPEVMAEAQWSSSTPPPTDTLPPSVPTGLTATTVDSKSIDLNWTASVDDVGVVGYQIYRNGIQVADEPTTSHRDSGLSAGTTYTYNVKAYDAAGNISGPSTNASATTAQKGGKPKR
ncbi:MAG TPA: fibronectin type III domain-containing protein [Candidatus Anammoximicrobium sp.]|mgnify:CR=1 FL=1|nr:fibronectin type III domain-containing protein [Candidatus Anammoximicrobium sp.]